jgi:hypothetical protein
MTKNTGTEGGARRRWRYAMGLSSKHGNQNPGASLRIVISTTTIR